MITGERLFRWLESPSGLGIISSLVESAFYLQAVILKSSKFLIILFKFISNFFCVSLTLVDCKYVFFYKWLDQVLGRTLNPFFFKKRKIWWLFIFEVFKRWYISKDCVKFVKSKYQWLPSDFYLDRLLLHSNSCFIYKNIIAWNF